MGDFMRTRRFGFWVLIATLGLDILFILFLFAGIGGTGSMIGSIIVVTLTGFGVMWFYAKFFRNREIVVCQSCDAQMTIKRFEDSGGCPSCGSDLRPLGTGERRGILG